MAEERLRCPQCNLPLSMGRHHIPVILAQKVVTVCEPHYSESRAYADLLAQTTLLREIALAALSNDTEALERLVPTAHKILKGLF